MKHSDWVVNQFKEKRTKEQYRDVLIHTSFVETIVREETEGADFSCAIKILGRDKDSISEPIGEMESLRKLRNEIVHDLLKNPGLTSELISSKIKEMKILLRKIYNNSSFVRKYFRKHYSVDTEIF